jgi:hypothetical protein
MRTQIKILGTIDILIGAYFAWTFAALYETTVEFIRAEFILAVWIAGLIVGGVGLWIKKKAGWIANQMTGIHIVVSAFIAMIVTRSTTIVGDDGLTNFFFTVVILTIIARLFWTNRQTWLDEFRLSNKLRLTTIAVGTIISLVLLLKSYV